MSLTEAAVASVAATDRAGEQAVLARALTRTNIGALVDEFVATIERKFPQRLKSRPKALKRRVLHLIRVKLPPHPRPAGPGRGDGSHNNDFKTF